MNDEPKPPQRMQANQAPNKFRNHHIVHNWTEDCDRHELPFAPRCRPLTEVSEQVNSSGFQSGQPDRGSETWYEAKLTALKAERNLLSASLRELIYAARAVIPETYLVSGKFGDLAVAISKAEEITNSEHTKSGNADTASRAGTPKT